MKEQTFIVNFLNADGITKDFYRFSQKTIRPILKEFGHAIKSNDIFMNCWNSDKITQVVCYATPDGYNESEQIFNYPLNDFITIVKAYEKF